MSPESARHDTEARTRTVTGPQWRLSPAAGRGLVQRERPSQHVWSTRAVAARNWDGGPDLSGRYLYRATAYGPPCSSGHGSLRSCRSETRKRRTRRNRRGSYISRWRRHVEGRRRACPNEPPQGRRHPAARRRDRLGARRRDADKPPASFCGCRRRRYRRRRRSGGRLPAVADLRTSRWCPR